MAKKNNTKALSASETKELFSTLKLRFEKYRSRHQAIEWNKVHAKLEANPEKCWSLNEMEKTGGEPDVVAFNKKTGEYTFVDCSPESPKDRRSVCYDQKAFVDEKRK